PDVSPERADHDLRGVLPRAPARALLHQQGSDQGLLLRPARGARAAPRGFLRVLRSVPADLAQLVEQPPCKRQVARSSRAVGTIIAPSAMSRLRPPRWRC